MLKSLIPPIIVALAEWLLNKLDAWMKQLEKERKIKDKAKGDITDARKIKDRKDRAKRIDDIINN